jgi:ABC-type Fe3+/spermidine/putrescine transport system ATPase subunit
MATHDSADALSFSDEIIVLKEGELLAKTKSAILYKNPKNKYIASLFGEVNELRLSQLIENYQEDKILLLYPHQLKVVKNGFLKVIVKHSYFKGSHFLIEALANEKVIFFYHHSKLDPNLEVTLSHIKKLL